ncbi:MAG: hypothetical protein U1G07_18515 [Verrucomicrobiota bacterium]
MVRCDVNVSVRPRKQRTGRENRDQEHEQLQRSPQSAGVKIPRQIQVVESGGKLIQSTRRWDDVAEITEKCARKNLRDYRLLSRSRPDAIPANRSVAGRSAEASRRTAIGAETTVDASTQLPAADAQTFVWDKPLGAYFEALAPRARNPKVLANWVINNLRAQLGETKTTLAELRFSPEHLLDLLSLVESGKISSRIAQEVFAEMFATGQSPAAIVDLKGLAQVSDASALEGFCDQAIAANPRSVEDYRAGKLAALNFLKGQVMKASKGKANPALVGEMLERKLKQ